MPLHGLINPSAAFFLNSPVSPEPGLDAALCSLLQDCRLPSSTEIPSATQDLLIRPFFLLFLRDETLRCSAGPARRLSHGNAAWPDCRQEVIGPSLCRTANQPDFKPRYVLRIHLVVTHKYIRTDTKRAAMSSQPSLSWPQGNANETYLALGLEMPIMAIAGSDPELIFLGSSNYLLFMQQNMTTSGNGQLNMSDNLLASSIDPFVGFSEPSGLFSSSKSKPNNMRLLAVLLYADTNGSSSSSSSSSASDSGSSLGLLGLGNSVEEEDDTSSPFNWTTWAADMNTNPGLRMDFDINDFASRAGLGSPIAAEVLIVKSDEEIVDGGSSTSASWTAVSTLFGPKTTADPAGAGTSSSQAVTATANGLSALNAAAAAQATGAAGSGPSGSSASGTSRAGASGAGASGIGASGAAGSSGAGATVSPVLTSASGLGGDDDNACDDDGTGDGTSSDGPSGAGSSSTGSPSAGTGSKSGGSGNSGTGGPGSPNNEAAAASASRRPSGSGASPSGGSATRTGGGGSGGAGGPASRTTTSSAAGSKPTSLGEALVGILQDDDKSVEIGLDLDHGEYATVCLFFFSPP